jgi:hypothetical protein
MAEFTPEEIIAHLNTMPRAVPVLDAVLEILEDSLPGALAALDLPAIVTWGYAGEEIAGHGFPAILVTDAIRTEVVGVGFADTNALAVICAFGGPTITRRQLQAALDTVQVVRGILTMPAVVGPRYTSDGRLLWAHLLQDGISLVPPNFPMYRGAQAQFHATQYTVQESNLWTPPEPSEP